MAPEQVRGDPSNASCDLYALSTTMFELLSGRLPYEAVTVGELLNMKLTEPPRALSSIVPSVDPLLEDIILRGLALDPEDRHSSARVLRTELTEVLKHLQLPSTELTVNVSIPPGRPTPKT
jgi:serine/threonine-protein kinase